MGFDKVTYNNQYKKDNYCRIVSLLPQKYKEIVTNRATELGLSMTQYIKSLIDADCNITDDDVKTPDH